MKQRPLKIKFNHLTYEVGPWEPSEAGEFCGLCDHSKLMIRILRTAPPSEQARILWHEIIHAMYYAFNLEDVPRDEEAICGSLESPLTSLIYDNPHITGVFVAAFAGKPIVS